MPKTPRVEESTAPADVGLAVTVPDAPPQPPEPPAAETVPARTHFTPAELAVATGNATNRKPGIRMGGGTPQEQPVYSWQHNAAAQLHGWAAHEHHAGAPIQLTPAEYQAALKAASEEVTRVVEKDGKPGAVVDAASVKSINGTKPLVSRYEPHKAALSPHAPNAPKEG